MNCQRFDQVVSDLARSQMMEADVRSDALAHSEECGHCRARLRNEETLTRGLRLLAADMETLSAPDEIELKLRKAFRSRQVPAPALESTRTRSPYWLVAVAAALLVVMGIAAMWWRSDAPQQQFAGEKTPEQIKAPNQPAPQPQPQTPRAVDYQATAAPPRHQAPKPVHRNNVVRKTPEAQLSNHVTSEIATDFVPLGDLNLVSLQDGGQIVRVTVRRSTLVRFGFPVDVDRYNENVKADVLVGADGLARAIRFVQ